MPDFCNGYVYAMTTNIAGQLAAVSQMTPLLPLDDIYVSGVLRSRLKDVNLTLLNRFEYIKTSWIQWILQCPFLGVLHHHFIQDLAYEKVQFSNA